VFAFQLLNQNADRKHEHRKRWFRGGRKWQTGSEERISVVKRRHSFDQLRLYASIQPPYALICLDLMPPKACGLLTAYRGSKSVTLNFAPGSG
jgi:hypothetical protein